MGRGESAQVDVTRQPFDAYYPISYHTQLAVVVSSLSNQNSSLAVSNVIGSMTANILGSFSIGLLFRPAQFDRNERFSARLYVSLMLFLSAILLVFGPGWGWILRGFQVGYPEKRARKAESAGRWVGFVLLGLFGVYIAGIAWGIYKGTVTPPEGSDSDSSDSDSDSDMTDDDLTDALPTLSGVSGRGGSTARRGSFTPDIGSPNERSSLLDNSSALPPPSILSQHRKLPRTTTSHVLRLIGSTLALSLTGYLLSSTTESLAIVLGLSSSTLGLTLLSVATTLPEKLVAYKSARKSQTGVLVANTVGSNVFLGTLVLGIVWTVTGSLPYTSGNVSGRITGIKGLRWIWVDVGTVLVSSAIMWTVVWFGLFKRSIGVVMLALYVGYIVTVFLR